METDAKTKFKTVDEYFSTFPKNVKNILTQLRKTIKQAAPQAEELISYNMPAFKLNGILVYYAAYNKHIGFYPTASGIETFKNELSVYKWAKGSIQFPLDQPLPTELITNIVKFRVMRNSGKAATKAKRK
ncbi:MAG: DUF1801 domain-containing protein [Ignavibacteria bacterium]|nr:DUF1801 domain-containing protein [Ignavibacteria bacterium]